MFPFRACIGAAPLVGKCGVSNNPDSPRGRISMAGGGHVLRALTYESPFVGIGL